MKDFTSEEIFLETVHRINRYLIVLGLFFLGYFLLKSQVDVYLFFLALSNMAFALLSHKHIMITNRLAAEVRRTKAVLEDITKETRKIHPDSK